MRDLKRAFGRDGALLTLDEAAALDAVAMSAHRPATVIEIEGRLHDAGGRPTLVGLHAALGGLLDKGLVAADGDGHSATGLGRDLHRMLVAVAHHMGEPG